MAGWRTVAALVGVAFAIGLGVGRTSVSAPAGASPAEGALEKGPHALLGAPVPIAERAVSASACDDEVAPLRDQVGALTAQLALLGGVPTPWPADLPPALSADDLGLWLPDAFADVPADLVELDCSEFPCLAVARHHEGQPGSSAVMDPVRAAFATRAEGEGSASVSVHSDGANVVAVVSFDRPSREREGAEAERLRVRTQDLLRANAGPE